VLEDGRALVTALTFSAGGSMLARGALDGTVRISRYPSGEHVADFSVLSAS
jgi:WD40 repeat protein